MPVVCKSTLCPMLLIADPTCPREKIDSDMEVVANHIDTVKKYGLTLEMSQQLYDDLFNRFPWALINDPEWRQVVFLWQQAVLTPLRKCPLNLIPQVPQKEHQPHEDYHCALSSLDTLCMRWSEWLSYWDAGSNFANQVDRNIGVPPSCDADVQPSTDCIKHHRAHREEEWLPARFPWMKIYSAKLPPDGDFPFVPEPHWRQSRRPRRGNQGGYLDREGNQWVWDPQHYDHWDVQLYRENRYLNVTPEGRIL